MFKKFFAIVTFLIFATADAQEISIPYEGLCHNGIVSAKPVGAKGPVKILPLMIGGIRTVSCAKGDEIILTGVGQITDTPHQGRMFPAVVSIIRKDGRPNLIVLSTFQEKPFPRGTPGKSI